MKKRKLPLPLLIGLGLVLCSLCLILAFQLWIHYGTVQSQRAVMQITEILPQQTNGIPGITPDALMPVLEVDGRDYIGLLEIPSFGITLPITDKWDSKKLTASPARYWGSVYNNSLVVGGADYSKQFGFCDEIDNGAYITVTDMTGACFTYTVTRVDRAKHADNLWLLQDEFDLTLFCKSTYSTEYIAVRCAFAYK